MSESGTSYRIVGILVVIVIALAGLLVFQTFRISSTNDGVPESSNMMSVTQTATFNRATATVIFSINATMITTTGNFSIPDIRSPLPNGTLFQITRVESPPAFISPPNSCTITMRILEYTTSNRPSFFAFPMWITFNESPCDSNGPTTYHLFHDAKVIKVGTVKQTQP